ncbi:MAG: hypothetical protein GTO71_04775 [Woeseiaceae bacterium]|nr:hypothetical protein [Woeseiaceae bacterium]NIP20412.1 hypothetical protein [Woeseiaceae bacterium]NIS89301.1 hypothetical protein [Woeseiaceae bacterium]
MTLIQIPTEQTTAATDLLIAVLAIASANYLRKRGPGELRGRLWRIVFLLLAVASLLGAIGHGLVLGRTVYIVLWWGAYLALALLVAAFLLATIRDLAGDARARQALPFLVVVAIGFFGYFALDPDNFLPFILYESTVMILALAGYIRIAIRGDMPGATWIAASITVNILAALVQAGGSLQVTVIWTFDHNGIFHLVQILAMGMLVYGLRCPGECPTE